MSWTPEKEEKLKQLWKKGHSGSQIAAMLGNTTRNAVIGKAHRLKLEARSVSSNRLGTKKINTELNKNSSTINKNNKKLGRKAKFKALLLDKDFEPENPTKLENLTDELCKWPLGEKMEPASLFCGRKSIEKFPYCKLHLLYAFQPKNAKEEDQITEDDMPQYIEKKIKSA
jgi:GcrA cell cycle regulator